MKKTALISGGTKGIGKGAVLTLLEEGFNVATFSRDKENCIIFGKELSQKYEEGRFLVKDADVSCEAEMEKIVDETISKFGRVDVLLNNAGFGHFMEAGSANMKKVRDMIDTNLYGLMTLTTLVVPHMKKEKEGLIINISSISGKTSFPTSEFYSATKWGVMGFSDGLRKELKEQGIKVCTVCPGMIKTNFFDEVEMKKRKVRMGSDNIPMLEVEDINKVIKLICTQSEGCDIQDITVMPS